MRFSRWQTPFLHLASWRPFWVLWMLLGAVALELAAIWVPLVMSWMGEPAGRGGRAWMLGLGLMQLAAGSVILWLAFVWGLVQSLSIRLLAMLHLGFLWLGVSFVLAGASQLLGLRLGTPVLGLGALHALTMGCLGSLMLAMVTRVSCGHSGRTLVADNLVWALFWLLQLAVLLRIGGALNQAPAWLVMAAALVAALAAARATDPTAAGISDSKLPDMQAGWEQGITNVLAGLSGLNMVYESVGMHASLLGFCLESLVLGDDLLGQTMRLVRGIDVTPDSTSLDAMKEVCLGGPGHYLGSDQTLKLMQTEYIYPKCGNRMSPKEWNEAGKPLLLDTAIARKNEILPWLEQLHAQLDIPVIYVTHSSDELARLAEVAREQHKARHGKAVPAPSEIQRDPPQKRRIITQWTDRQAKGPEFRKNMRINKIPLRREFASWGTQRDRHAKNPDMFLITNHDRRITGQFRRRHYPGRTDFRHVAGSALKLRNPRNVAP